jgi:hypothetical protein
MRLPKHPRTFFAGLSSSFYSPRKALRRTIGDAPVVRLLYVWLFALSYGMDGIRRK